MRASILPFFFNLVTLFTSLRATPVSKPTPVRPALCFLALQSYTLFTKAKTNAQASLQTPHCTGELPLRGYPPGFSTWHAGVRNLQYLCVDLVPDGPHCTCTEVANGSWFVTCNPTGSFASHTSWPNVMTYCVWGCACDTGPAPLTQEQERWVGGVLMRSGSTS